MRRASRESAGRSPARARRDARAAEMEAALDAVDERDASARERRPQLRRVARDFDLDVALRHGRLDEVQLPQERGEVAVGPGTAVAAARERREVELLRGAV